MRLRPYQPAFALAVVLLCAQSYAPSVEIEADTYSGPRAVIEGRVLAPGTLAAGLRVDLIKYPGFSDSGVFASTATDGSCRYRFGAVPRGRYWLGVRPPDGYVAASEPFHEFPGFWVYSADGNRVVNPDLELIPGGAISGRIIDVDGNPVAGEWITADPADKSPPQFLPLPTRYRSFSTDQNGYYRISGLPPGAYIVSAGVDVALETGEFSSCYFPFGSGRLNQSSYHPKTFHPAAPDRANATSVQVSGSSETPGVNILLPRALRTFTASGRVVDAETGAPVSNCIIGLGRRIRNGYSWGGLGGDLPGAGEGGTFTITGLLPGRFFAGATFDGDSDFYGIVEDFEITDADVDELELKVQKGTSISGLVVIEDDPVPAAISRLGRLKVSVSGAFPDAGGDRFISREAAVAPDGTFRLTGLTGGQVQVSLLEDDLPFAIHFSIARIEHSRVGPGNAIEIAEGEPLTGLRVVAKYCKAILRGEIDVKAGQIPAGMNLGYAFNTLKPPVSHGATPIYGTSFKLKNQEPGEYEVYIMGDGRIVSEAQRVTLNNDNEARLRFTLDPALLNSGR